MFSILLGIYGRTGCPQGLNELQCGTVTGNHRCYWIFHSGSNLGRTAAQARRGRPRGRQRPAEPATGLQASELRGMEQLHRTLDSKAVETCSLERSIRWRSQGLTVARRTGLVWLHCANRQVYNLEEVGVWSGAVFQENNCESPASLWDTVS